jgi:ribosomal protein S18 acetylase RimI-like enzyme
VRRTVDYQTKRATQILKGPEHVCLESVYENLLEFSRHQGKSSLWTVKETEELFLVNMGLTRDQTPFSLSGIWKTNLEPDRVDKAIDEVIAYYQSRNVSFMWGVYPSCKPDNLGEYLEAHNFKVMGNTPLMAIELHKLVDDRPRPTELTIEEVADEDSMRLFFDIWHRGYPMPKPLANRFADVAIDIGVESDVIKYYIGYVDDQPVATSWVFLGAGVAGLFGVTVLPEGRGRGLGTEMSMHPLREARAMGYHIGVLDATQQGYGIYERIGFEDYGTPKIYVLSSPEQKAFDDKAREWLHSQRN